MARPAARPAYRQPEMPAQQPAAKPQAAPKPAAVKPAEQTESTGGGGWKIAVQFILGLMVIAGVAATIVWLYLKYYTQ